MAGRSKTRLVSLAALFAFGLAVYVLFLRKRLLRWGTPQAAAKEHLPGDEIIPRHDLLVMTTRSVVIRAAPGDIWPWLVQIGQGRGGFYSYDWLENLFRMDIHNADRILPDHQSLHVGDFIPFWKNMGVTVRSIEPERSLVLAGNISPHSEQAGGSWVFVLQPAGSQATRLTVRARVAVFPPIWLSKIFSFLFLEPAHFIMERKMLQGIRARAEANRSNPLVDGSL